MQGFILFAILLCFEVSGQYSNVPSLHNNANFHIGTSVRFAPFSKDTLAQKYSSTTLTATQQEVT